MNNVMHDKHQKYSDHWDGIVYRDISLPQYTINTALLTNYNFKGDEEILDIGCGDGTTTRELAKRAPRGKVIGIDASSSMIKAAKAGEQIENLKFKLLNANSINFLEQFDLVTSFFCIQWVVDKLGLMHAVKRSLKTGGHFVMITPMPHQHLPEIRKELILKNQWKKYFINYTDPLIHINDYDYKYYASEAGLKTIDFHIDPTPVIFPNYNSFFEFMCQMTPHLYQLPIKEEKKIFISELLEEYLKIYPVTEDGKCRLDFNLIKFFAQCPVQSHKGSHR